MCSSSWWRAGYLIALIQRSDFVTAAHQFVEQPVQFSHQHHAGGIGIDCRYCHTSVEMPASAGIPPTKTCINCHSQIWSTSPYLEPVRASFREDRPLRWVRVHDLPDFVYFNHSIHINKGVGCETCHGRVDRMPLDGPAVRRCRWNGVWTATAIRRSTSGRVRRCFRWDIGPRATSMKSVRGWSANTASRMSGT